MKLVRIGTVLKTHGYRGSFTVSSSEGKESVLGRSRTLFIGNDESNAIPYSVLESAWMPRAWKVTVEGITSDTAVQLIRKHAVYVDRDALPENKSGEYYLSDLIGLEGIDTASGKSIGFFSSLTEIGTRARITMQHTWFFKRPDGSSLQIPAVPHFICGVDLPQKKIFLHNLRELEEE